MEREQKSEDKTTADPSPMSLVATFQRCSNYPRDFAGVLALAQGLKRAADTSGVSMAAIVEKYAAESQYCPTDADLLAVARELQDKVDREEQDQKEAREKLDWEHEHGSPRPFDWKLDREAIKKAKAEDAELMRKLGVHFAGRDPRSITGVDMYRAKQELGYALTAGEIRELRWESGMR